MEDHISNTLKDMLGDRGIKSETFDVVTPGLPDTKTYLFGGVLILDSEKNRITASEFNNIIAFANKNNYSGGIIIITQTKPSESILNLVRDYISQKDNQLVQIFYRSNLNFSYARHRKVPNHRLLNQEEVEKVLNEFNISKLTSLRKIDSQDPMAKWIGARPGDVIEITGMCATSAENKRYCYCLANTSQP
jgi:DNA-directed RNA polymerase subunit H (RpoH/RPB5)